MDPDTNRNPALIEPPPVGEPAVLKGYLNKYANVARGYSTRWFVLREGMLSCMFCPYAAPDLMLVQIIGIKMTRALLPVAQFP